MSSHNMILRKTKNSQFKMIKHTQNKQETQQYMQIINPIILTWSSQLFPQSQNDLKAEQKRDHIKFNNLKEYTHFPNR